MPKGKSKKVIGLKKDNLVAKIIKEFLGLRLKTYRYLKYDNDKDKKGKGTKESVIKRKLYRINSTWE